MAIPNSANPYLKTQVETATKEQLVVMLFDGIIRFTEQARKSIQNNEIEEVHHLLMRAQAIVMELIYTVDRDKGGDIAKNLLALHAYAFNCLIVANMKKDVAKIDEVQKIYRELREGWVGAMKSLGLVPNAAAPSPAAAPGKAAPAAPAAQAPATAPASARPAAPQVYGAGKTAIPSPLSAQPRSEPKAMVVPGQQQRSASMLSAYSGANRSIA